MNAHPFELVDISTLKFFFDNTEYDEDKMSSYHSDLTLGRMYSDENRTISILVSYSLLSEENKNVLGIDVGITFLLEDYNLLSNKDSDGNFDLEPEIMNQVLDVAFSISKGVLAGRTEGLKVGEIDGIPLFDPRLLA